MPPSPSLRGLDTDMAASAKLGSFLPYEGTMTLTEGAPCGCFQHGSEET